MTMPEGYARKEMVKKVEKLRTPNLMEEFTIRDLSYVAMYLINKVDELEEKLKQPSEILTALVTTQHKNTLKLSCEAVQHSDQMICNPCGITYDVNDQYPPTCKKKGLENIPAISSGNSNA